MMTNACYQADRKERFAGWIRVNQGSVSRSLACDDFRGVSQADVKSENSRHTGTVDALQQCTLVSTN